MTLRLLPVNVISRLQWAYVFVIFTSSIPCDARTALERSRRDELVFMADDHPLMAVTMQKARASLADFLSLARRPEPSMTHFSVKVGIKDGSEVEYFWILPFTEDGDKFTGQINNTPRQVKSVKEDQIIDFRKDEIVDWMYFDGNRMKGNFTACALLSRETEHSAAAFKRQFGLECGD